MGDWLYTADPLAVYAVTVLLMVGAVELGALLGRRDRARHPGETGGFLSGLAAQSMGLLALMIGFTFAMALSRFETRKEAVVDEANTIGTASLRGRMLPAPFNAHVAPLLKEYATLRVVGRGFRWGSLQAGEKLARSEWIQDELWMEAMAAAKADPSVVPTGLFIQALNAMIDMHGKRLAAGRNRVPAVVFLMLEGVALVALGFSGHAAAQNPRPHRVAMALMAVMIASVITLVLDLDNPQAGIITVSQQPMLDVIRGMR